jgi:polysaccharide export outer membrane protein
MNKSRLAAFLRNGSGFVLLFSMALLTGCASSADPSQLTNGKPDSGSGITDTEYKIGVDDRVQVSVWKNPDLSVIVPVRPDGKISVPLIGDVAAGGKTANALADSITEKLSRYVRDPNVTVIVTELRSHEFLARVRVTGAVQTPRSFPFRPGMTVLDAVLEAGGISDFAAPNRAKLYRSIKGKTQIFEVELGDILSSGELDTNFKLSPGDVIAVPERFF